MSSFEERQKIINPAEVKRQVIIKSDKFLSDTKNYKHHYTSRLLNEPTQQVETFLNLYQLKFRTTTKMMIMKMACQIYKKNYKHHPEPSRINSNSKSLINWN